MSVKTATKLVWIVLLVFSAQGLFASVPDTTMVDSASHCASMNPSSPAGGDFQMPMDHTECGSQCFCCQGFGGAILLTDAFTQALYQGGGPLLSAIVFATSRPQDFHFRPPILI